MAVSTRGVRFHAENIENIIPKPDLPPPQKPPRLTYFILDCTLIKKENQIFLIYEEIQIGAVAKSYITNGLLVYDEIFAHFLIC
jgi:hypothetical protein